MLLSRMKESWPVVVMFDESLNCITKRKQTGVHVRSWEDVGPVSTRYLTSEGTAEDMNHHFQSAIKGLHLNNIWQISMDGPNLNRKFFNEFQTKMKQCCLALNLNVSQNMCSRPV